MCRIYIDFAVCHRFVVSCGSIWLYTSSIDYCDQGTSDPDRCPNALMIMPPFTGTWDDLFAGPCNDCMASMAAPRRPQDDIPAEEEDAPSEEESAPSEEEGTPSEQDETPPEEEDTPSKEEDDQEGASRSSSDEQSLARNEEEDREDASRLPSIEENRAENEEGNSTPAPSEYEEAHPVMPAEPKKGLSLDDCFWLRRELSRQVPNEETIEDILKSRGIFDEQHWLRRKLRRRLLRELVNEETIEDTLKSLGVSQQMEDLAALFDEPVDPIDYSKELSRYRCKLHPKYETMSGPIEDGSVNPEGETSNKDGSAHDGSDNDNESVKNDADKNNNKAGNNDLDSNAANNAAADNNDADNNDADNNDADNNDADNNDADNNDADNDDDAWTNASSSSLVELNASPSPNYSIWSASSTAEWVTSEEDSQWPSFPVDDDEDLYSAYP